MGRVGIREGFDILFRVAFTVVQYQHPDINANLL